MKKRKIVTEMKNILKLEEVALLGLTLYGLYVQEVNWWWYLLLLFGPDISMLGYLAGNRAGAVSYNIFHHKGLAVFVFMTGLIMTEPVTQLIGLVLFGHSSFDRIFGYGLKTREGFKYTHLGIIGKK